MKRLALLTLAAGSLVYAACNASKDAGPQPQRSVYLDLPADVHKYYGDERWDNKATLGRVLFYERNLSVNGTISCGTCHKQNRAFADDAAFSRGFQNHLTGRNTPALQDITDGTTNFGAPSRFFWDGRSTSLTSLIGGPITNHVEMGVLKFDDVLPALSQQPYYSQLFANAYGDSKITTGRIADAISIFVRAIRTGQTRFDQYQINQAVLSAQEVYGQHLFATKYNCMNCHNENLGGYTGDDFADIGLEQSPTDLGLGTVSGDASQNGMFKVPNLRNVALTAPYMHDGRFKTLDEVLEHYSHGIQASSNLSFNLRDVYGEPMRMNISQDEKQAIIAFLNTLTDPVMTTDPYLSDPFKTR